MVNKASSGFKNLAIAASNLSVRYQRKKDQLLCKSQFIRVKDILSQLLKDGIDNKLDYLIR